MPTIFLPVLLPVIRFGASSDANASFWMIYLALIPPLKELHAAKLHHVEDQRCAESAWTNIRSRQRARGNG